MKQPSAHFASARTIFAIDLRTLALFRITLGLYLLADCCLRARDLTAHYTDIGIMPRDVQLDLLSKGSWSLHLFNGSTLAQGILFVLTAMAAVGLIVGWRTRWMTFTSWVLLLSVQNRNTFILSGEDNLALLLTFWAMFLPLGAQYSFDRALDRTSLEQRSTNQFCSVATIALLVQGMSMYFFSAILKSDPIWIPDGTAVYYALQLDYLVTPLAVWFRQFETVLQGLTYYVWTLELIGPFLIFSPILHRPLRALIMILFMTMHLGFFLFLEIGLFPVISIIMNLTFMPGWMWDALDKRLRKNRTATVTIWYDRDCSFCLKMCRLLRVFLFLPDARIVPAQDNPEMGTILERENSWIVTLGSERGLKWEGLALLIAASPVFKPLAGAARWSMIRRLGTAAYQWVARHRDTLSKCTQTAWPWRRQNMRSGVFTSSVAFATIIFVTIQNLSTIPVLQLKLPDSFIQIRQALGLYQNWTMFAPHPEKNSPWPVIEGELEDGTIVDLYHLRPGNVATTKPRYVSATYANGRWRKYLSNLEDHSYGQQEQVLALNYARYLCRAWSRAQPELSPVSTLTIRFVVEKTPAPGQQKQMRVNDVWFHDCFDTN